jgi:hypothetical protein
MRSGMSRVDRSSKKVSEESQYGRACISLVDQLAENPSLNDSIILYANRLARDSRFDGAISPRGEGPCYQ